jgi:hypothetical protein
LRGKPKLIFKLRFYNNCTEFIYSKGVSDGTEVGTKNDKDIWQIEEGMWNRRWKHMVK